MSRQRVIRRHTFAVELACGHGVPWETYDRATDDGTYHCEVCAAERREALAESPSPMMRAVRAHIAELTLAAPIGPPSHPWTFDEVWRSCGHVAAGVWQLEQEHGPMTQGQLAATLKVNERTIERARAAMRDAGVGRGVAPEPVMGVGCEQGAA